MYKARCENAGIKPHHHALPRKIYRAMKKEMWEKKGEATTQTTLDSVVVKKNVKQFTRQGLLHDVAKFVVCDDQVSSGSRVRSCDPNIGPPVLRSRRKALISQLPCRNAPPHQEGGSSEHT